MVPIGFPVGDFIAGINILIQAVHSPRDTNGAQADYQRLKQQLKSSKIAFGRIEASSLSAMLGRNIAKTMEPISLKRQGRKIQWGIVGCGQVPSCAAIQQHSDAIQMLLASMHR